MQIEHELKTYGTSKASYKELNTIIDDLRQEKKQLEEAYNKLRSSIQSDLYDKDREVEKGIKLTGSSSYDCQERNQYKTNVRDLEVKLRRLEDETIPQMRETLQKTIEKLESVRSENEKLRSERGDIQVQLFQFQQKNEVTANRVPLSLTYIRICKANYLFLLLRAVLISQKYNKL